MLAIENVEENPTGGRKGEGRVMLLTSAFDHSLYAYMGSLTGAGDSAVWKGRVIVLAFFISFKSHSRLIKRFQKFHSTL